MPGAEFQGYLAIKTDNPGVNQDEVEGTARACNVRYELSLTHGLSDAGKSILVVLQASRAKFL